MNRVRIGHRVHIRIRERIDNVAGNQARLAVLIASDVAGDSVNEHTELSRLEGGQLLRDRAAITPVSTSPVPPVAMPGLPVVFT